MNDQNILRSENGVYFQNSENNCYVLRRNIFRQYEWELSDSVPTNCVETTLKNEGFVFVGEIIMKDNEIPPPITTDSTMGNFIVEESGGFTMSNDTKDRFVSTTHAAVRSFDQWIPENAQQKRYKSMIEKLEKKATKEEDEYHFNKESCMDDFKNPI